ncbi:MAG: CHASE domain-containing protein [Rhodospirillales bacterium]|nr:CHASE domain-containing protein [Rhodospirillales bacterium]
MVRQVLDRLTGHLAAWIALALGVVATGFGWHYAMQAGLEEVRSSLQRDADRITVAISSRVQFYEQVLMGAAALYSSSDKVSREEWRLYVASQRIADRFPELQAIAFAEHVAREDMPTLVERMRQDGDDDFAIQPPGARPLYTPTIFSEPETANGLALIGMDLQADLTRWQALTQATAANRPTLNSGRAVGTPPLEDPLRRLEIFVPAWRDGQVRGFAYAPLNVELFISTIANAAGSDLTLRLYDGILGQPGGLDPNQIRESRAISLGGRLWTVDVVAKGRKAAATTRAMPSLVIVAGATISFLLFLTARTFDRAREGERRFRDYAQMATDWLWEHDRNLRFTYFFKTRGGTRTDVTKAVLGKTRREIAERIGDAEELAALNRMERLMHAGHSFTGFEYSIRTRAGGREFFRITAKPLRDLFGQIRGFRGTTQVVTGERRREQELRDAKAAAEAGSASKSRFLAMMSHELRTPLNAIIGFSEVIASQRFGPNAMARYADYAQTIHSSGQQLLELISQLLDMSKIEAGKLELEEEDLCAGDVIEDCVTLLSERAQEAGIALTPHLPSPAPVIRADRRALRQVLINLVSNAIKFTSRGGRVELGLQVNEDGTVAYRVADTGIGISAEAIARLFQPFQQADASITRKFGGTGLGLAISRALVEAHGGSLTLDSAPDRGTTAWVVLPAARRAKEPAAAPQAAAPPRRAARG